MTEDSNAPNRTLRRPISFATRQWVKERDKYRCVDCGTHESLTVDHIIPVVKGGTNDTENLTTRCQSCNSIKGTKTVQRRMSSSVPVAAVERDRLTAADERASLTPGSLVGSYFHGTADRSWQGCVVAEITPQVYLVELFSWIGGDSTHQELVRLDDMTGWWFYDSCEWMNSSYNTTVRARWERRWDADKETETA